MVFQKGHNLGKRFSSEYQPKKNGRKPQLYTQIKDVYQISLEEYKRVVHYLMNSTEAEIRQLKEGAETPMWVVNLCSALLADSKKGTTTLVTEFTDRLFGKPKQITENYNETTERNKAVIVFTKQKDTEEGNSD